MHITSKDVKKLSERLRKYPDAGGTDRRAHSNHALGVIDALRKEPMRSYMVAAAEWGGAGKGWSIATRAQSFGAILGRIATVRVEVFAARMHNDSLPRNRGGIIQSDPGPPRRSIKNEITGEQRGELKKAFNHLFLKAKDFDNFLKRYSLGSRPLMGVGVEMLAKHFKMSDERHRWNRRHNHKLFDAPTCSESWHVTEKGKEYLEKTTTRS